MFRLYVIFALLCALLWGLSGCQKSGCLYSGFVAQNDTLINCASCKDLRLAPLDTFVSDANTKCGVKPFQARSLTDWLERNEVIRVGMEPDAPPAYFTEGDKETGFDYELLKQIFPLVFEGIRMEVKGYKYDTLPKLLLQPNPQIEIIAGGYVADTSLPNIIWTKPYITFGYALITREKDAEKYKTLDNLTGMKVGVYDDGITEQWLRTNCPGVGKIVTAVDNTETPFSDWMQMLTDGRVDAIVYDYPFAIKEIEDYDEVLVISNKRLNKPDDLMGYSFGIPAGNTKLLKQMNEAIERVKLSPAYQELVANFLPNPDLSRHIAEAKIPAPNPTPVPNPAPVPNSAAPKPISAATKPEKVQNPPVVKAEAKSLPVKTPAAKVEKPKETTAAPVVSQSFVLENDGRLYTVQEGENLKQIATKVLNDPNRWEELYLLNPHIVSPDILYAGTALKLPKYEMVDKSKKQWGDPTQKPVEKKRK